VLEVDPASSFALSRVAYLHLQAGDDARARQYAARAVELDATSSEGWIVLGAALEALRDRAGARAAYQQCAATGAGEYAAECRRLAR
jgi:Flp pilus assembly protein TadD